MAGNIKSCVIDASFILSYLFPAEKTAIVEKIFIKCKNGEMRFFSPKLLPFEVLNSIKYAVIKKRFSQNEAEKIVKSFFDLDIEYEEIDFTETFKLAVKNNLTVYDSAYLNLSFKKKIPLLTFDKDLIKFTKN